MDIPGSAQPLLVGSSETLLLVDDDETKVLIANPLSSHGARPDHHMYGTVGDARLYPFLL